MKRQIFLWVGLAAFCILFALQTEGFATPQYVVKPGDNLQKISKRLGVSPEALKAANRLDGDSLKAQQILNVPSKEMKRIHIVRKGETLSGIAKKNALSLTELRRLNKIRSSKLRIGQKLVLFIPPQKKQTEAAAGEVDIEEEGTDGDFLPEDLAGSNGGAASAELLGRWQNPDEQQLFVRVVRGFLGAPYRLGGSSVRGIDCSAFVKNIYEFFNISLPRTAREQSRVGLTVSRDELIPGDLVFFNTRRPYGHVGIYIGNNEFIHASSREKRVTINSLDSAYFNKRFIKAIRVKGIDEGA
ncbi:MAG: NlpC/P60 family protein [Syntrophales bacterium]|jgi:LysM repeat protein|nr:NlpC/P60 family protein [Syntrophales bacterium]